MIKFLRNLFVVCFPALLLIGYLEYKLSGMDTHYHTKRLSFEQQLDSVEILSLGSSNAYFGINPTYYSRPGYNLAFNYQSPYYDYRLVEKYIDRMSKLKVVILPSIYFQMGVDLPKTEGAWRMYFYRQYFNIPLESQADNAWSCDFMLEPKNFSKIALYGGNIYSYFLKQFKNRVDYDPERNGWYNSSDAKPARLEDRNGELAAGAHNQKVDVALFQKNLAYWQRLADLLQKKNVKLVVIRLPSHSTYYSNLDPEKVAKLELALSQFAERNHGKYEDYTKDSRIALEDYTPMLDHMNPQGAAKFTAILDHEVLQPLLR